MSYTVLARRYRSTNFDEIVGQESIARTLKNAIERGRLAHAYLFTGTRGVGKTSMARIFAKAMNVTEDLREKEQIAAAILRGEDIDVIEIDGASNRGIDQARDLIANAGLSPARCPYKVYIIDEVHMLTTQAFNALLKTMEEPPSHVKFILCTTEPHKVPATIQSRCQRFDFHNISALKIAAHVRDVLEHEQIAADDVVVNEVARLANGSMRDSLSLLDRLIAAGKDRLTRELLEETLGVPDQAIVAGVVSAILAGDAKATLQAAAELLSRGVSIEQSLEVLTEHLRNVMVINACGADSNLVELFGAAREAAIHHAEQLDTAGVVHLIALCDAAARHVRGSSTARAIFEAVLVRMAMSEQLALVPALLEGSAPGAAEKKKPVTSPSTPVEREPVSARGGASIPSNLRPLAGRATAAPPSQPTVEVVAPAPARTETSERDEVLRIPIVKKAVELFEAAIVRVSEDRQDSART